MKIEITGGNDVDNTFGWEKMVYNKGVYQAEDKGDKHLVFISVGDGKNVICVENNDTRPVIFDSSSSWRYSKFLLTDKVVTFKN